MRAALRPKRCRIPHRWRRRRSRQQRARLRLRHSRHQQPIHLLRRRHRGERRRRRKPVHPLPRAVGAAHRRNRRPHRRFRYRRRRCRVGTRPSPLRPRRPAHRRLPGRRANRAGTALPTRKPGGDLLPGPGSSGSSSCARRADTPRPTPNWRPGGRGIPTCDRPRPRCAPSSADRCAGLFSGARSAPMPCYPRPQTSTRRRP